MFFCLIHLLFVCLYFYRQTDKRHQSPQNRQRKRIMFKVIIGLFWGEIITWGDPPNNPSPLFQYLNNGDDDDDDDNDGIDGMKENCSRLSTINNNNKYRPSAVNATMGNRRKATTLAKGMPLSEKIKIFEERAKDYEREIVALSKKGRELQTHISLATGYQLENLKRQFTFVAKSYQKYKDLRTKLLKTIDELKMTDLTATGMLQNQEIIQELMNGHQQLSQVSSQIDIGKTSEQLEQYSSMKQEVEETEGKINDLFDAALSSDMDDLVLEMDLNEFLDEGLDEGVSIANADISTTSVDSSVVYEKRPSSSSSLEKKKNVEKPSRTREKKSHRDHEQRNNSNNNITLETKTKWNYDDTDSVIILPRKEKKSHPLVTGY